MIERSQNKRRRDAPTPEQTVATPPKVGRRERNKQEKLGRILAASRRLFRSKGFAATTATEIAEAADIGFGTLFLYARSKEELLVMVFKDEMNEVVERTFAKIAEDAPLLDQVLFLFAGFIAYHKRNVPVARALIKEIFFLENPDRRNDVKDLMRGIYRKLSTLVARAKASGRISLDAEPLDVARNMFGIYIHLLQVWLGGYLSYNQFRRILPTALELQIHKAVPANGVAAQRRVAVTRKQSKRIPQ